MKLNKKHAFVIIALGFLLSVPAAAAANSSGAVLAQDVNQDFFFNLINNGAEVVFTAIDEQGAPAVVYGQLGVPSEDLGLGDPMYQGCILMALIATHGELLNYVLDLIGGDLFNFTDGGSGPFMAQQFGEGGFDVNSIFDMLGTDFSLLINVFINVDDTVAQTNMAAIRSHLHTGFNFDFSELLNLRIDEEFIASITGENVTLPFSGINLFIYKVTNAFEDAVNSVLDVMDPTGFISSIDRTVFTQARASGAGLLAIPDMGDLMDLINDFGGGGNTTLPTSFLLSQMPDLQGPVAIAAAGYIGDQILDTNSDELNIFEDLLGKPSTSVVNGLSGGQSLVGAFIPENMNLTGYSPEDEASGYTYYDANSSIVFWNATAFADQPDYTLSFTPGEFPPLVTITRTFVPDTTIPGGSTDVTVSVHNKGTEPVQNVNVTDNLIGSTYTASVNVTGNQVGSTATLLPGAMLNITYTVTFKYEGVYAFAPAQLSYDYNNVTFSKHTHTDGYTVTADPIGLLQQMFWDGYPYTAILGGGVALGAIVNLVLMARRKGGGGTYQV
jgi:hypothetical protein